MPHQICAVSLMIARFLLDRVGQALECGFHGIRKISATEAAVSCLAEKLICDKPVEELVYWDRFRPFRRTDLWPPCRRVFYEFLCNVRTIPFKGPDSNQEPTKVRRDKCVCSQSPYLDTFHCTKRYCVTIEPCVLTTHKRGYDTLIKLFKVETVLDYWGCRIC